MSIDKVFNIRGNFFVPLITLVSFVFFLILGSLTYSQLYQQRKTISFMMGRELAEQIGTSIELWLEDQVQFVFSLSGSRRVQQLSKEPENPEHQANAESLLELIHKKLLRRIAFLALAYVPQDKQAFFAMKKGRDTLTVTCGDSFIDSIGGRSFGWTKLACPAPFFTSKAHAFIGKIVTDLPELPPFLTVSVPVEKDGSSPVAIGIGVYVNDINKKFIKDFVWGKTGYAAVVNSSGVYLGNVDASLLLKTPGEQELTLIREHLRQSGSIAFSVDTEQGERLYTASPVMLDIPMEDTWWVLTYRMASELHDEIHPQLLFIVISGLCGTFFMGGLAYTTQKNSIRAVENELLTKDAERTAQYVDNAPYGLFIVDRDGRIIEANHNCCAIFGYGPGELEGRSVYSLVPDCPLDWDSDQDLSSFEDVPIRLSAWHKDGQELIVAVSPRLMHPHILLYIRDVTDVSQHEQQMRKLSASLAQALEESEELRKEAERANQSKSSFLASMSHEIRTPMNAVLGMAHLLLESGLSDPQRGYAQKISAAARSLLGIINDILDFSKIEAGKMSFETIPFGVSTVLEDVNNLFSSVCQEKGIVLHFTCENSLPEFVLGDPLRLGQILINLVGNAVKFTQQGSITVSCRVEEQDIRVILLRFEVRDTGIGISKEQAERLFDPFSQAEGGTARQYGGSGLGLTICKRMLDMLGGSIFVQSEPGKGSTFTFFYPLLACDTHDDSQMALCGVNIAVDGEKPLLEGVKILLVEDNEINQEIATELLVRAGAQVWTVNNGEEALHWIEKRLSKNLGTEILPWDIILMDVQMPVMDGLTATRHIRKLGVTLPIIAMTAHVFAEEREKCIVAGMNDHVAKPIEVAKLYTVVQRWRPH